MGILNIKKYPNKEQLEQLDNILRGQNSNQNVFVTSTPQDRRIDHLQKKIETLTEAMTSLMKTMEAKEKQPEPQVYNQPRHNNSLAPRNNYRPNYARRN